MIKMFMTNFTPDGEKIPVTNFSQIGERYLKNGFIMDVIPLIPFPMFMPHQGFFNKFFYMLKNLRMIKGYRCFKVEAWMAAIKLISKQRLN